MNLQIQAIVFSFIAMLGFGLETGVEKKFSKQLGAVKLIIFRNIFVVAFTFIALVYFINTVTFDIKYLFFGVFISIASYGGIFFFLKALCLGKVGLVSPIVGTRGLLSSFIGIIFFREILTSIQMISILVVFIGIVLSTINFKDFKNSNLLSKKSGIPYAILAAIFWGITFPLFSIPAAVLGAFLFTFILESSILFASLIHSKVLCISVKNNSTPFKQNFVGLLVIGLLGSLGSVFMNLAYATGQISSVSTILSCVPLVALLYGWLVYKEKMKTKQYIAVVLMVIGIVGLSFFKR